MHSDWLQMTRFLVVVVSWRLKLDAYSWVHRRCNQTTREKNGTLSYEPSEFVFFQVFVPMVLKHSRLKWFGLDGNDPSIVQLLVHGAKWNIYTSYIFIYFHYKHGSLWGSFQLVMWFHFIFIVVNFLILVSLYAKPKFCTLFEKWSINSHEKSI